MQTNGLFTPTSVPISEDHSALIRLRLRSTGHATLRRIECEYHDGVVVLRGRVPTFYAKQLAQTAALGDPSVQTVENLVEVSIHNRSGARNPR